MLKRKFSGAAILPIAAPITDKASPPLGTRPPMTEAKIIRQVFECVRKSIFRIRIVFFTIDIGIITL